MRRFLATLAILEAITLPTPATAAKKPKMVVQVYALDWHFESLVEMVDAYLILPDGTRARGTCMSGIENKPCSVESFAPEKRSASACQTTGKNAQHCVYKEDYYAERNGNLVTLHAANGKVTYRIVSTWEMDAPTDPR